MVTSAVGFKLWKPGRILCYHAFSPGKHIFMDSSASPCGTIPTNCIVVSMAAESFGPTYLQNIHKHWWYSNPQPRMLQHNALNHKTQNNIPKTSPKQHPQHPQNSIALSWAGVAEFYGLQCRACCMQHGWSWVQAPNLHQCLWTHLQVCRLKGLAAILTSIQSAGVTPKVNLRNASEGSTLALKPRGDVIRSPKQGYQWPHKKDLCPPNIF